MDPQTNAPTLSTCARQVPRTPLGKKLLEIRQKIVASGRPLLTWDEVERAIAEQRGRETTEAER